MKNTQNKIKNLLPVVSMTTGGNTKKRKFVYGGKSIFLYFPNSMCGKVISISRPHDSEEMGAETRDLEGGDVQMKEGD
jgi:hypothetical protein